jgi:predicted RNA-binding Zn-ribbon protein involved in translation (DUF1610 family)
MIKYKHKNTDLETEPDYPVTFSCIKCGDKNILSGEHCEYHEINQVNFVCEDCLPYDSHADLPCAHQLI